MKKLLLSTLAMMTLAACSFDNPAGSDTTAAAPTAPAVQQYKCENGKDIFFTSAMAGDLLKGNIKIDDVVINMHQVPSGSGVILAADDTADTTRWHVKGDVGLLSYQDNGKQVDISCTKQQ